MASPRRAPRRVWYFFSADLPDGEILVPIETEYGLAYAVRPDSGMDQQMLDRLNEAADHALGIGLLQLTSRDDKPPEREE